MDGVGLGLSNNRHSRIGVAVEIPCHPDSYREGMTLRQRITLGKK